MKTIRSKPGIWLLPMVCIAAGVPAGAMGQAGGSPETMEVLEVIGVTPTHGVGLPKDKIPANVQSATNADLERAQSLDLTDFMNRNLGSVTINHAQNNPLQPDVQFRGFTASPLLGLPQGIAVYHNGIRVNEPFGDEVNWDLIPMSAIGSINLIGGANPLFGLNTLGGALSIETKNGFTHPGRRGEVYGGSFGRVAGSAEVGDNNGTVGYYLNASYFEEDGWRDFSDSDALNVFGSLGFRGVATEANLNLSVGDTSLKGNGASPVQLLQQRREAVFTHPDLTENELFAVSGDANHWLNDQVMLSGNAFYRKLKTRSFNGDGGEFEDCEFAEGEFLVDDDDDFACDGSESIFALTPDQDDELLRDQFGNPIDGDLESAINNISRREQEIHGASGQVTFLQDLFGKENQFIFGASYSSGTVTFDSQVEAAELLADRGTSRTGIFVDGEGTAMSAGNRSFSVYLTDTINLTPELALTLSGRYNNTRIKLRDRSGDDPDLNGRHTFSRFNPAAGLTYRWLPNLTTYASYSESNRAPTPVELACARPDRPCRLPNAFLADPPLEQVVARSWEAGLRGAFGNPWLGSVDWNLGGFYTVNEDDIIFQAGGATANQGFFDNVGDTRRLGMEAGLRGQRDRLRWFLNYSFVEATFRDSFFVFSPNHPDEVNDTLLVRKGNRIPGIAEHSLKIGGDYEIIAGLTVGADLVYNSDQVLRGDEANLLSTIDGHAVVNLRGEYRINKHLAAFARIENLFDSDYETFGLLGEPDEVLGPSFDDPRFFGAGAPRAGFVGIRVSL